MDYIRLQEKPEILAFLERDPFLHLYSIGDLDDFFWPYTSWYGSRSEGELEAIVLVYAGPKLPTVCGLSGDFQVMARLLGSLRSALPDRFYAHLSPDLETVLSSNFIARSGGAHHKMALQDHTIVEATDTTDVVTLYESDLSELGELYDGSYPGNWFDPRMLQTGQYVGIRDAGRLVSAAGVHVYSAAYRVAALGNIVTHQEYRGRGYGSRVTAALCKSLLRSALRVGLNVHSDNAPAMSCYRHLGFEIAAPYAEFEMERKTKE